MSLKKILIIDNDPSVLLLLDYMMKKNGYEVFVARNGNEAIEILNEQSPNAVLIDSMMPNVDGRQIYQFIKSNLLLAECKIIFLSGKNKAHQAPLSLQIDADDYLTKPFNSRALMQKVNTLLK